MGPRNLTKWYLQTPKQKLRSAYTARKYDGRNFWTVFSMDLGRQDFPRSASWLESWSVGSLTGSASWMRESGLSPESFHKAHTVSRRQSPANFSASSFLMRSCSSAASENIH
eukprot:1147767-Amphidinium_carterae.1